MNNERLKEILFNLFNEYNDYEDIISGLRSLNSENIISNEEYNIILENYNKWLKEWEEV
jgi:hypothetical protein